MTFSDLNWHRIRRHFVSRSGMAQHGASPLLILALTDNGTQDESEPASITSTHLIKLPFADITKDFITALQPDYVLTSLTSQTFDCVEVAQKLHEFSYTGRLRILTNSKMCQEALLGEVRACCAALDVAVINIDDQFDGSID